MVVVKITLVGLIVILGLSVTKRLLPVVKIIINVIKWVCLRSIALDTATRELSSRVHQRMKEAGKLILAFVRLCTLNTKKLDIPNKVNRLMNKILVKTVRGYYSIINWVASYIKSRNERKELKLNDKKRVSRQIATTEPDLFNCREDFYDYQKQLNKNRSKNIVCKTNEKLDETVLIDVKAITELIATNKKSCAIDCNNCNYMKNPHCPNCISCMLEREGYCSLAKQCSFNLRKECAKYYSDECELRKSLLFPD